MNWRQEQQVDFPVRMEGEDQPPILSPPPAYQPPILTDSGPQPSPGAAATGQLLAGRQQPMAHAGPDPFAGMSEEDKAAIRAAMAEMEAEEHAVRESGEDQEDRLRISSI